MRISDWSSDVCSSDLHPRRQPAGQAAGRPPPGGTGRTGFGMTAQPIKPIFGVDGAYSQHLAVTLVSLLENNPGNRFDILVVTLSMAEDDRDRILALAARFGNVMLRFQPFDIERYSHFRTDGHISHASYLRIFIPEILPDSVEKILYLDCDIVVRNDIAALWNLSLGDKEIGRAHV